MKWEDINQLYDIVRETSFDFADLFVENHLIVELKACKSVTDEHVAQRLGYLTSSRVETGLLINFGAAKLYVKKYLMTVNERRQH